MLVSAVLPFCRRIFSLQLLPPALLIFFFLLQFPKFFFLLVVVRKSLLVRICATTFGFPIFWAPLFPLFLVTRHFLLGPGPVHCRGFFPSPSERMHASTARLFHVAFSSFFWVSIVFPPPNPQQPGRLSSPTQIIGK